MTTRILPPVEWPRLSGTELQDVWPQMDPTRASVIVVEHEGQIVGCWALLQVTHVEGVWIAPEFRNTGSVARRLLARMKREARASGSRAVVTSAVTPEVASFAERIGAVALDGQHFVLNVEES